MTRTAVIVDAVRTPAGKRNGKLKDWHPADLAGFVLKALEERNHLDPSLVDDVIMGCVSQVGQQAFNIGRNAVLAAGWPETVPATTVDRQCGSSQQAIHFAAQGVIAGAYDIVVAAGVEIMTNTPMGSSAVQGKMGSPFPQSMFDRYAETGLVSQGIGAEMIADEYGLTRDDLDAFGSRLAYDANAIYYQDNVLTYDFEGYENAALNRSQTLTTSGRMNEMVLSFAGNYDEKLMVGATVGVPFVNYRLDGEYRESDMADAVPFFDRLSYTEYLRTEGVGVNLKLGVAYRVSQSLRLGMAFHTPTYLGLTDSYSNTFAYDYTDGGGSVQGQEQISPDGVSDYRLRTPWRAIGSAAVLFKKLGFLSADVEVVDYSANAYNLTADVNNTDNKLAERDLNAEIQRAYRQTANIRVGGEVALDDFRLRAGVNLLGKPQVNATGFNTAYTAGAGIRGESFYLDLGYRFSRGKGSVTPYFGAPSAATTNINNELLLTLGFKF